MKYARRLHVPASTSESTGLATGVVPLSTMFHGPGAGKGISREQPRATKSRLPSSSLAEESGAASNSTKAASWHQTEEPGLAGGDRPRGVDRTRRAGTRRRIRYPAQSAAYQTRRRVITRDSFDIRAVNRYGSFLSAWRTLPGVEAMNMIRKGRVKWLSKGNVLGHAFFIAGPFGIPA
jgi:hypothetical protein